MDLGLKGKSVLVTGGNRGIGRQIALSFAEEGANVAICARDAAQLAKVGAEIKALGAQAHTVVADLFRAEDCQRAVDETAAAFGRLDILVNNASTNVEGSLFNTSDEKLMERLHGKTLGAMRCSRAAVPHMRRVGGGRIICMGGASGRSGASLPSGLGNAAMANFAKNLSIEVAADQILVNMVHPSFCKTDRFPQRLAQRAEERNISLAEAEATFAAQVPIGRVIEPADIAPVVLFLASRQASAITGQSISVDGGTERFVNF